MTHLMKHLPIRLPLRLNAKDWFDRWLREYPRATPIAVFVVALLLVIVAAWSVELAEKRMRLATIQSEIDDITSALERQAASDTAYLEATSALFASVDHLSPEFFGEFVERLRVIYDLNGVVGLGWSEVVEADGLSALHQRMSDAGHRDFRLYPDADPTAFPVHVITMLEPRTHNNRALIGFDMHSEARRAAAMDKALATNSVAATDSVKLRQDATRMRSPGFLVYAPVWSFGDRKRFRGHVYIPIRTEDFVTAAVSERLLAGGSIDLYDDSPDGEDRIFSSAPPGQRFGNPIEETLAVFDQHWTLKYAPPLRTGFYPLTFVVLFSGTAFSMLLLAYVLLMQRRNGDLHALLDAQLAQEQERAAFVRELNHRVKNSLANVTSIISLTRRNASDLDNFADTLLQRVRALATSHSLLDGGQWGPTDLKALISAQLSPYDRSGDRLDLSGPAVLISPNDALTIGLALHELATNAQRYGSLSSDEGRVSIQWTILEDEWVQIDWLEMDGPTVSPPAERGFGLNLIERALAQELRRPIEIHFEPAGLRCRFFVQLREPRTFKLRQ